MSRLRRLPVASAVAVIALAGASPARAQGRVGVLVQGIADGELWSTDTNSTFLARNGGKPGVLGRMQLWSAIEPSTGFVLYGMVASQQGKAGETESEFEQFGARYTASRQLVIDAGKFTSLVGTFASRRFSNRNPLIGVPDGYPVQYPVGVAVSGSHRVFDYRAGIVSLPVAHEGYTPDPSNAWRPAVGAGITPIVGVRLGASWTAGPYLNKDFSAAALAQRDWKSYKERIVAADVAVSVGYIELQGEASRSSYDVPNAASAVEGTTYYGEAKYTFTPRLYAAVRLERNDYPFIALVSPTFWVGRRTDFHNEEFGVGFRATASTLVKASYRQDKWHIDAGNAAFVRPGGNAFAMQLSQSFDVMEWVDRARAR